MTVTERVEKGAALLDEQVPGWVDRIGLADLDLASMQFCVVGQLFGVYHEGVKELGIYPEIPSTHPNIKEMHDCTYVFDNVCYCWTTPWSELTQAWRDLITRRRIDQPVKESVS